MARDLRTLAFRYLQGSLTDIQGNPIPDSSVAEKLRDNLYKIGDLDKFGNKLGLKLTQLFNTQMKREEALMKIQTWIKEVKQSKLICFNKFIKTLNKFKQQIIYYFIDRNGSGFVEGLNNKVKVLKR